MELEKLITEWQTPATSYPIGKLGSAEISRVRQGRGNYLYWGIDGFATYRVVRPIPITVLKVRRKTWMVDDPPQYRSMQMFGEAAYGHVVTTGLGLGLIVHELVKNSSVTSITVVEINPDVITLMSPFLPHDDRVKIIEDDFYQFIENWQPADCFMVDLWVTKSAQEKERAFFEALPLRVRLSLNWPKAQINFHGFISLSDTKVVSEKDSREWIAINKRG